MRSESTSAFGQPSETKPTFGVLRAISRLQGWPSRLALGLGIFRCRLIVRGREARISVGEVGKLECAEDVTRLLLQLLLHLEERLRALLKIARHQSLDRRSLHLDELAPGIGIEHWVVAEFAAQRLLLQASLYFHERLNVLLQIRAHHPLHRVSVETDDLRQHIGGEHRRTGAFFFEDDLQQNAARQILIALGVDDTECNLLEDELLYIGQRDVAAD